MTHNNLFIAFALFIALSTNICFSAQKTFKYDSLVANLINILPNPVINIMHKLTPKDALFLAGGTTVGLIGLFIYYRNKSIQDTKKIMAETKPLITETLGEINASNEQYLNQIRTQGMQTYKEEMEQHKKKTQARIENQ